MAWLGSFYRLQQTLQCRARKLMFDPSSRMPQAPLWKVGGDGLDACPNTDHILHTQDARILVHPFHFRPKLQIAANSRSRTTQP
ncbi:hypothetical protein VTO42DRAFT_6316 [Malbranchea cinnamomea]